MAHYEILIIGGGPAGYTAALYAARSGRKTAVIEKLSPGGQMATTSVIDNYPGFPEGVDGFELGEKMEQQARKYGAETIYAEVTGADLTAVPKVLHTSEGDLTADAVIIATGAYPRELGLPGESELRGRGIAYCAACDGMSYRGKVVAVNGGGNTAVEDALYLSKLCSKVYLIHRRDSLRASAVYHKALEEAGVEIVWNSRVTALRKEKRLTGIELENVVEEYITLTTEPITESVKENVVTGEKSELACDGLFVAVGRVPDTALFTGQVDTDGAGYLVADESCRTSVPGVFAAGDVRTKALRQVITAAADGANAAHWAEDYLVKRA